MKLLFVTGSRGEWGYIRPILELCKKKNIDYSICATNMHLLPSNGLSIEEIKKDGFDIEDEIYMALNGDNHFTMLKSLGIFLCSFSDVLKRVKPDWIILAGDRGEQLVAAIAGGYTYVPTAHIQAGELSGNIDGIARHALGKFVHIHFAANRDAAERLKKLGEEEFRIFQVGAPQLDELVQGRYDTINELKEKFSDIDLDKPYFMVVQHPVTEEFEEAEHQIKVTLESLKEFDIPQIWILPNNDAGCALTRKQIQKQRNANMHIFSNLKREEYLGLLKNAIAIIGNSSSGVLEAPTFKIPAINIGNRQNRRLQGKNVINTIYEKNSIVEAIKKASSAEFKKSLIDCINPYGDGKSSEKILDVLLNTKRDDKLLSKQLTY